MKPIKLGPYLGINNRRPNFDLHVDKTGDYLRAADNVDINDVGNIVRRRGVTLLQAMTNAHSLRMVTPGTGFMVRASVLYAVTLPAYSETLLQILSSDATMTYAQIGMDWYFSNGTDSGRVSGGVAYPIGMKSMGAPTLSTIGGSLLPGHYEVSFTYTNSVTGEEGAVSNFGYTDLTTTGGIRAVLPGPLTGATHVNVYLSESNGTIPMLHSTVTAATTSIDLTVLPTGRPISPQRNEDILPPGTLFSANGRLCSFKDEMVYVGLPWRPGYYQPLDGFIPFPGAVTIAISNQGGTYIAADKTYFFPGDLGDVQDTIRDLLPYGAVPGTAFADPHNTTVGWFGAKGFVLADTSGVVDTNMANNIDQDPPDIGIAGVCECDGYRRVTACGYTMNLETKAVTTYSDWAFTSQSGEFGTKVDGVYQTNTAAPVVSVANFGRQDFGTDELKYMPAIYLGVSSTKAMNMRVKTPSMDYTYASRSSSADLEARITPGKGLRANWFELELSNTAGADFTLAEVSFDPIATTRRI